MTDKTPKREITSAVPDTTALKALTHPDRLRMLGILRFDGPATASGLARRLGLNSGATSYHLRQLHEFGFVEPATDLGNKRDRWWRARHDTTNYDPTELYGEAMEAGLAAIQGVISQHALLMQRALQQFPQQPPEWRKAFDASDYTFRMTAEQALALKEKIAGLLWEELSKSPPVEAPHSKDTKQFMIMLHAFPFPGFGGTVEEQEGEA